METETTMWIGKHVLISVSISSNLIQDSIFLCKTYPHHLVLSFTTALEGLATQSKTQMKMKFIEFETAIFTKLCKLLEQLNQRHNRVETVTDSLDDCIVDSEEQDLSMQFLQMQKKQLIDLQQHFERYCNVMQVFGFKSAKNDLNLIETYLIPILANEEDFEPTDIKKANQFVPLKFGDIQLLDFMNFLVVPQVSTFFSKPTRQTRQKDFSPMTGLIVQRY